MGADELEDYLELRGPAVKKSIAASHRDYVNGKSRPARNLFSELAKAKSKKGTRSGKR